MAISGIPTYADLLSSSRQRRKNSKDKYEANKSKKNVMPNVKNVENDAAEPYRPSTPPMPPPPQENATSLAPYLSNPEATVKSAKGTQVPTVLLCFY